MRMMLKIKMPTESGNRAIKDGSLGKLLEDTVSKLKAEAAYFIAEDGVRCAMIFFDMKDSAEIPPIAEPLFIGLGAELELVPVMNSDDLRQGLRWRRCERRNGSRVVWCSRLIVRFGSLADIGDRIVDVRITALSRHAQGHIECRFVPKARCLR